MQSDTVNAAAEECSIMSCAKSQKRFSGGWLLVDFLYVDDFVICYSSSNMNIIERKLQQTIYKLEQWADLNGFKFSQDKTKVIHSRALRSCIWHTPKIWKRRPGRPRHTWLRTVEADLRPFNLGLASGFKKAQDRTTWRTLTGTATSLTSPE